MVAITSHDRPRPVPEHLVWLTDSGAFSEHAQLKECLEGLSLFGQEFRYTAVHKSRLESVRNDGTIHEKNPLEVFVFKVCMSPNGIDEWIGDELALTFNIFDYLDLYRDTPYSAHLVVYHASALTNEIGELPATFKDPSATRDAVAAIVRIMGI